MIFTGGRLGKWKGMGMILVMVNFGGMILLLAGSYHIPLE